jgi:hypothetical protein
LSGIRFITGHPPLNAKHIFYPVFTSRYDQDSFQITREENKKEKPKKIKLVDSDHLFRFLERFKILKRGGDRYTRNVSKKSSQSSVNDAPFFELSE